MPRIFDNIEQSLLPALTQTLAVSTHADFCVGYFNLRGWKQLDGCIEQWPGGDGHCCRLLIGMQRLPQDELRQAMRVIRRDEGIDNQTAIRLKKRLAEEFREQLVIGTPTNADEAGLRRLAAQEVKDVVLQAYRQLAPNPDDAQLAPLIATGESSRLEFKEAAAWNRHTNKSDGTMRQNIVEEVAAFLNTEGGAVVIGVADDRTVVGLADDYKAADLGKPNRDGYELFLRNTLNSALGANAVLLCAFTFHQVNGKEVCRISISPSGAPVYVDGNLFIRSGNQKKKLNAKEATTYVNQHWPS